jgi:hypothetical protein
MTRTAALVVAYLFVTSYLRLAGSMRWRRRRSCVGCDWKVLQYPNGAVCSTLMPYRRMVRVAQWCAGSVVATPVPGPTGAEAGEGVVLRSPSVASTDSGAESFAYAGEPASVGCGATAHNALPGLGVPYHPWANGLIGSAHSATLSAPLVAIEAVSGGATRDIAVTANWPLSEQVGIGAPRRARIYDMTVIDQQSGRWYVRDIRASTQPMGTQ